MQLSQLVDLLEAEWAPEDGFFWKLRQGAFDARDFERARSVLARLSFQEDANLPRRLVSLLWYIPCFMEWQGPRVKEGGGDVDAYSNATATMTNLVEELLGVP